MELSELEKARLEDESSHHGATVVALLLVAITSGAVGMLFGILLGVYCL